MTNGFTTEYIGMSLWVEAFRPGAAAIVTEQEETGEVKRHCRATEVTRRSDFPTAEDYEDEVTYILKTTDADTTAEFVTDNDIYYVQANEVADTEKGLERCKDCIYLVEGDNGEWICTDWEKEVHEVPDEDCAAESPYRTWSYLIVDNATSDVVKEDHGYETEEDAYEQAKAEIGYENGRDVRIETYQS